MNFLLQSVQDQNLQLQRAFIQKLCMSVFKLILTLPTWGLTCTNLEEKPFEIANFYLGHPVIAYFWDSALFYESVPRYRASPCCQELNTYLKHVRRNNCFSMLPFLKNHYSLPHDLNVWFM